MTIREMNYYKELYGLSYDTISEMSGIPKGTIQKILTGITKAPRSATLEALERAFLQKRSEKAQMESKAGEIMIRESVPGYGQNDPDIRGNLALNRTENADSAKGAGRKKRSREKKPGEYTLEDYYALPEERWVELIDGVFYDMTAPSLPHQLIVVELALQCRKFIDANEGKCEVFVAPLDVQLDCDDRTMVQPDVVILCDEKKGTYRGIFGAPDFVAEVLSPGTGKKDFLKKVPKYAAAGVKECWLISPEKQKIMAFCFQDRDMNSRFVFPDIYSFTDRVPVGIYDGRLKIDLSAVSKKLGNYPSADDAG